MIHPNYLENVKYFSCSCDGYIHEILPKIKCRKFLLFDLMGGLCVY